MTASSASNACLWLCGLAAARSRRSDWPRERTAREHLDGLSGGRAAADEASRITEGALVDGLVAQRAQAQSVVDVVRAAERLHDSATHVHLTPVAGSHSCVRTGVLSGYEYAYTGL